MYAVTTWKSNHGLLLSSKTDSVILPKKIIDTVAEDWERSHLYSICEQVAPDNCGFTIRIKEIRLYVRQTRPLEDLPLTVGVRPTSVQ